MSEMGAGSYVHSFSDRENSGDRSDHRRNEPVVAREKVAEYFGSNGVLIMKMKDVEFIEYMAMRVGGIS